MSNSLKLFTVCDESDNLEDGGPCLVLAETAEEARSLVLQHKGVYFDGTVRINDFPFAVAALEGQELKAGVVAEVDADCGLSIYVFKSKTTTFDH